MKYYSEENNGRGQQKMITKGKLRGYINWLNETKGGSFLRATASGSNKLLIERMDDISGGTIHWTATRDTQSSQLTASTSASSITITSNYSSRIPRGKFYLVGPDGTQYTELDNSNTGDNYSGFEDMTFIEADEKLDTYCLTYSDLSGGTYARVFDEATMKDGIVIDGYSISSSGQYKANQLVAEKDVNFGKLTYDLVVSSITVEVDAMNDLEEYRRGVIPGSNGLAYATVYDVTNGTETPFYNFDLNGAELTDNAKTNGKTYSGVTISKGGNIAKASKRKSGSTDVYAVDVYYYADSGYTLSSQTIATIVGNASGDKYISASTHSFSSNSTSPSYSATSRMVKINIASNGEVKFDIKQRKEIYGYFPVSVYKQGTSDFAIDENGNVELSAINKFVNADSGSSNYSYGNILDRSVGWLSNAGDNFGSFGLTNGEKYLSSDVSSTYNDELIREGFPESALTEVCGKDVYNIDDTVYNRGEYVGTNPENRRDWHIAYANDAYDLYRGLDKVGGFSGTTHLFIDEGYLSTSVEKGDCTSNYLDYTFDSFTSEYNYIVNYVRDYYKDVHSYGITSILRRYRNINGSFVDTSSSYKLVNEYSSSNPSGYIPKATRNIKINGNNFPKHISGKTISLTITLGWNDVTNKGDNDKYKSGDNYISGWTTIYEYPRYDEWWGSSSDSNAVSGNPTVREIKYVPGYYTSEGRIECQANTSDTTYYYNIAPRFYMVDAESCSGGTSGYNYTFKILSTPITDKAYGITEDRYYFLDYDGFLGHYANKAVNNQMARKNMITYLSVSSSTPTFDSIRYGSTKQNGLNQTLNEYNIQSDCCPSAPTQTVYWVDTYAPHAIYGGRIFGSTLNVPPAESAVTSSIGLTYIDDSNKIIETDSRAYLIPTVYDWNRLAYDIGIDDINNFNDKSDYSFHGNRYYTASTNNSSHGLKESISFSSGLSESVFGDDALIGYGVNSGYNSGYPMLVLSGTTDYYMNGNDKIYSGKSNGNYEYLYFNMSGSPITNTSHPSYARKYVTQFSSNLYDAYTADGSRFPSTYKATDALRPCYGDVTVPYWRTGIEFAVRVLEQPEDESTFDPITQFGLTIDASFDNTNYTRLTTGGTEYNNVRHKLVTDTYDDIVYISDPNEKSYKGIYGYLSKTGSLIAGGDSYYQKMRLDLVFVDVYPTSGSCFDIVVNGPTHTGGQQKLHWRLDGKTSQSVGADIFGSLGSNGWGSYKENTKTNTLSCIGDTNNMYSVSHMLIAYALEEGDETMPFVDMLSEDFAVDGTSSGGKGTWY